MKQIIMTCGNIGTGKSTTVKKIIGTLKPGTYFVWSVDSIALTLSNGVYDPEIWTAKHKLVYEDLKTSLVIGSSNIDNITIMLDDCHMSASERTKYTNLAKLFGYDIHLIVHKSEKNIDNRMNESRGYERELWEKISHNFSLEWNEPTKKEGFTSITTQYL